MKFTQFLLCAIAIALPSSVNAASQKNKDRWFDIEVILFSQLGDKNQLKENFPDSSELPKYRQINDLLARYLNPDITSLKQLLPSCDSPQYKADLVSQNSKLPALFAEKSLAEISLMASLYPASSTLSNEVGELANTTERFNDEALVIEPVTDVLASPDSETIANSFEGELTVELSDEERAAIQTLVAAAQEKFNDIKFQYTPKPAPKIMCRIDKKYFTDIEINDPSFDYNGFTVDKMPLRINAAEDPGDNNTHLLSKASLKLGDVISDLRYSKNFRPILHMGWRQVARPKKQSVPIKVYAGDHFAADYQKKLAQYQGDMRQLEEAKILNSFSHDAIQNDIAQQPIIADQVLTDPAMLIAKEKKARIASIVEQISTVTDNTELLLKRIESEDLSIKVDDKSSLIDEDIVAPIPVIQDWFIEGLFNVHLKHYLFITADFNILDKNLAELATAQLAENSTINSNSAKEAAPVQAKAIRFKQNRRVISGEVHYFDHPYMGMIVQIRPYKKPKPEENE
jgi:hypothetical protein